MIDELQRDLEDDVAQVAQPTMESAEEVTPRFDRQDIPVGATVSSRSRSVESLDQSWIRTRECGVEKDRLTNKGFGFWGSSSGMLTLSSVHHEEAQYSVRTSLSGARLAECVAAPPLLKQGFVMILFKADAIFASSISKLGNLCSKIDCDVLRSSTDSTISTSLIHCIASLGNCEQVRTSVLNLIFQQANVADVVNLSK